MIPIIIVVILVIFALYYYSNHIENFEQTKKQNSCPIILNMNDPIMGSYTDGQLDGYALVNQNGNIIIRDEGYPNAYEPKIRL